MAATFSGYDGSVADRSGRYPTSFIDRPCTPRRWLSKGSAEIVVDAKFQSDGDLKAGLAAKAKISCSAQTPSDLTGRC
jgi:hypothetical protein